jgi:long-chain acyl-CoA synthetase
MLITELLDLHAKRQPEKVAVITDEGSLSYAELEQAVECMAQSLLGHGLRRGDRVAMHWHNSIELVVLMLGAFRVGLVAVPINPRLKAAEIAYILEHSGARLCFSEPALAPLVNGTEVVSQLPPLTGACGRLPNPDPDAPAMVLYTSGTTARPKGVVHTQRTLFGGGDAVAVAVIDPGEILLGATQISHIGALTLVLLPGLIQGETVVLLRAFDPTAALEAIERHRCTYLFLLPAFLQQMVEEQAARGRNVLSLRTIVAGGDTVAVALQRRVSEFFPAELLEVYGMTELLPIAINPRGAARVGSIGPATGATLRIIDSNGNDLEPGGVGELVARSPGSCLGYWDDPEATARLFEGGWLHTGDLASCDEDGYYWFKGRLKQIIIRGGCNISPQEVEEALYQHPAVLEAGVVGLPDPMCGEVPVAFIALRVGHCVPTEELLAHTRALLSDYKVPVRILFMETLPKGSTGKVDRRSLRDGLLAEADSIENDAVLRV